MGGILVLWKTAPACPVFAFILCVYKEINSIKLKLFASAGDAWRPADPW